MRLSGFAFCLAVQHLIVSSAVTAFARQAEEQRDSAATPRIGFLPLPIFYYTPETGIAGGAAVLFFHRASRIDTLERPSSASLNFIYTEKKQMIAELDPDVYLGHGAYRITGTILFIKYPQKFFGIGNNTPDSFEESYSSRAFRISFDAVRTIWPGINAGVSFLYETRSLSEFQRNGLLETGSVPGSRGGRTFGLGAVFQWDTRDNVFTPTKGRYYKLSTVTSDRGLAGDFDFTRLALDIREYVRVTESTVLALQSVATLIDGSAPFHKLAELGGSRIMRGYYEGRFRDNKLIAAQAEYRFPVYWRFGAAVFAGAGDVARSLSCLKLRDVKPSYGIGLRFLFNPEEKLNLRFDYGFGRNTAGFYITANEAF